MKKTQLKLVRKAGGKAPSVKRIVSKNKIKSVGSNYSNPITTTYSSKVMNVKHREMIGYVDLLTNFSVLSWVINPGLNASFPWLSKLAAQFEQYRFKKLSFEYVGRCSTSSNGEIVMAIDYDALDPNPTSIMKMEAYAGCVSDSVWIPDLSCRATDQEIQNRQRTALFTRIGALTSGDNKTYDFGKFVLACTGPSALTKVGKIFVSYDIDLINPQSIEDTESLVSQGKKVATDPTYTTGQDTLKSVGQHLAQSFLQEIVKDSNVPSVLLETFGKGNFTSILDAYGIPSSVAYGLQSPVVGSDADPYVLCFAHDWTGFLTFFSHVRTLKASSGVVSLTAYAPASDWPYFGAGVPSAGEMSYNHLYPWGVGRSSTVPATSTQMWNKILPGVGNTCEWLSAVSFDTFPCNSSGSAVSVTTTTTGLPAACKQAISSNSWLDWENITVVKISALAGQCFSAALNYQVPADNTLTICPSFVNSASGNVPTNSDGRYASVLATPCLGSGATDYPSVPDIEALAPGILQNLNTTAPSITRAAESYLRLVSGIISQRKL